MNWFSLICVIERMLQGTISAYLNYLRKDVPLMQLAIGAAGAAGAVAAVSSYISNYSPLGLLWKEREREREREWWSWSPSETGCTRYYGTAGRLSQWCMSCGFPSLRLAVPGIAVTREWPTPTVVFVTGTTVVRHQPRTVDYGLGFQ